jgi:hypothetical protein
MVKWDFLIASNDAQKVEYRLILCPDWANNSELRSILNKLCRIENMTDTQTHYLRKAVNLKDKQSSFYFYVLYKISLVKNNLHSERRQIIIEGMILKDKQNASQIQLDVLSRYLSLYQRFIENKESRYFPVQASKKESVFFSFESEKESELEELEDVDVDYLSPTDWDSLDLHGDVIKPIKPSRISWLSALRSHK